MSTDGLIQSLERAGELRAVRPLRTRRLPKRRAYLAKDAMKDLDDDHSPTNFFAGRHWVQAALMRWVLGDPVWRIRRRGTWEGGFLKRLEPPPVEIGEVKVVEPRPQVRLFGRFAGPDILGLTKFHLRDRLGDKGSRQWAAAMKECDDIWNALRPQLPLHSKPLIGDYVSENCDDYPI